MDDFSRTHGLPTAGRDALTRKGDLPDHQLFDRIATSMAAAIRLDLITISVEDPYGAE
jgi:hypothetical protein